VEIFAQAFVRNPDGSWFCRAPVQIVGPQGPFTFTPGTTFSKGKSINGYQVAEWLDDWHEHGRIPIRIAFLTKP
jgi:hypothetical protein